jgi:Na+-translocating ferredoxin:NAD+ oxidoreductase subunit G
VKLHPNLRLALILSAFACAACASLAAVHYLTAPIIEGRESENLSEGLREIFPKATDFIRIESGKFPSPETMEELKDRGHGVEILDAYEARINGGRVGIAVRVSGPSYAGKIVALIGVGNDKTIIRVKLTENKDTPGLGLKASDGEFLDQFKNKPLSARFEVKTGAKDVDAITGATITSRSVSNLVKASGASVSKYMEETTLGSGEGK